VTVPFDGKKATVGNGVMVALAVDSPAKVDALHARALRLGPRLAVEAPAISSPPGRVDLGKCLRAA
jgi:hypothetical protein